MRPCLPPSFLFAHLTALPSECYEQTKVLAPLFNTLVDRISRDDSWLKSVLADVLVRSRRVPDLRSVAGGHTLPYLSGHEREAPLRVVEHAVSFLLPTVEQRKYICTADSSTVL